MRIPSTLLVSILLTTAVAQAAVPAVRILTNQIGYETGGAKKVVVEAQGEGLARAFQVLDEQGKSAFDGKLEKFQPVDRWGKWTFARGDFSRLDKPGRYRIRLVGGGGKPVVSEPFEIGVRVLPGAALSDILYYLKGSRSSGEYDRFDHSVPFVGAKRPPVDAHGGWFDASGDTSKYLSHLSYANYMNPQQTPLVVWALLASADYLRGSKDKHLASLVRRLEDEALHGADFLVRMQDPAGYFYITVFDKWSHDPTKREICAYKTQHGEKVADYQAAFREGGGVSIAALARASGGKSRGQFSQAQYLAAAEKGLAHLESKNLDYADDHQENIIDDYTALLAATELFAVTKKPAYLESARRRASALGKRLHDDDKQKGFWRADARGDRPYFHGAEAGFPVVALLRYAALETDQDLRQAATAAVQKSLTFELGITREVFNPFGYARQYVKDVGGGKRSSFFLPHKNESGYWWQGEDARLASLAAAALLGSRAVPAMKKDLLAYATDQLDWVFGLNPFDTSMMQGKGHNNPQYLPDFPNAPGGICNGITAGFTDEHDIAFLPPPYDKDEEQNWRWSEQWIPHGAWMILALAAQAVVLE